MASNGSLDLVIVGLGGVGRAFIRQWRATSCRLKSERGIDFRITGMADRCGLLHDHEGFADAVIDDVLHAKSKGESIRAVSSSVLPIASLPELSTPRTLFVDATAAPGMAAIWSLVLSAGAGVVLANKLPLCEEWEHSSLLFDHPRVRYEATVGAGLPIMSTLRNLVGTGDHIEGIQGALSGTLGFLGGQLSAGIPFSQALVEAISLGYAEPDPSEDLCGRDVARKAVILSRSAGWPVELASVALEGFIADDEMGGPSHLSSTSVLDAGLKMQSDEAAQSGQVLRYLAQVSPEGIRVGMTSVSPSSAFATLAGPENCVTLRTKRYSRHPLTVTGPGAGVEVTAAGVLSDLIDLAEKSLARGDCL